MTTAVLLPLAGMVALPAAADAASDTVLHVSDRSPFCTDTGAAAGSTATPYCTIQAAADAAVAGDTVQIFTGAANDPGYPSNLTISSSGTAAAPITFEAVGPHIQFSYSAGTGATLTVNGASHVDLVGFATANIDVENSSDIDLSRSQAGDLTIGSGASGVSVERDNLASVTVGSGATGTVLAANIIQTEATTGGVSVDGAAGTDITNNTFDLQNDPTSTIAGISVTGGASGTSIENNVMWGGSGSVPELSVDQSSSTGTSEKYNVLDSAGGADVPYAWAGNDYSTVAAFQTASGQGTADVVADFDTSTTSDLLTSENPAVGSADSAAPGLPATDFYGNAWTDDTSVPATGTGPENYYDRGAIDFEEYTNAAVNTTVDEQSVEADVDVQGLPLGDSATITIAWGDGSKDTAFGPSNSHSIFNDFSHNIGLHQYTSAGTYTVTATITDSLGTRTFTSQVTTGGSTYVPVTPTRVLNTRTGEGAPVGKVLGGHSLAISVTDGVTDAPAAATISAVVLNVTVTLPLANGLVSAYPDGIPLPKPSNLNFTANETVANLTTVMVGQDGKVDLYTSATTDMVADVEGYYVTSTAGAGYNPITPVRLLDTRKGTGAPVGAVGAGKAISLQVSGAASSIPATGLVAAALDVTVTESTADGVITVFAAGGTTQSASNLNYTKGENIANMAVVKLGTGGKVTFTNTSSGTVQIIADVAGYYTSTGGDAFVPMAPWRALDTRAGIGQESSQPHPVASDSNAIWFFDDEFDGTGYWSGDSVPAAVVLNVTVVQPTANGLMIAYPGGNLPGTSNSNFSAGETLPTMVMVACNSGTGNTELYNDSSGSTQMIADVFGYFS